MSEILINSEAFSKNLYEKMQKVNPGIGDMELYEFRYALNNLKPELGWVSIKPEPKEEIEKRINSREFFSNINIKPRLNDSIVLDKNIAHLTRMLFVGMLTGEYSEDWIKTYFFFDVRGFYFLHRTIYFTEKIIKHLNSKPYKQFEQKQKRFDPLLEVGYKAFKEANTEIDQLFIKSIMRLIAARGTPILLALAGPTAAGKTEIVERLRSAFEEEGRKTTSIEMDNFLTDRDYREAKGIFTQGKEALHFDLFLQSLHDITQGKKISIPRYDFVYATSSHDLKGKLKPDGIPIEIEPADIVFMEGNFPFLIPEVVHLIGIKVVYLTDDPVRMKRKWRRDIDFRKKYEPTYFRNRFFKDQFIMAEIAYRPQMEVADIVVDTTGAAFWTTPEIAKILSGI
jgi:uridine kinase